MSSCHTPEPGPKPAALSGQLASTMPNMIISLMVICALMAAALAGIYLLTKPTIDQLAKTREAQAVTTVLPAFDSHPDQDVRWFDRKGQELDKSRPENAPKALLRSYPASQGGQSVGTAVRTFSDRGYGKRIIVMVGFLPDGSINKVQVMEHGETTGFGDKMLKSPFADQFPGKNPANFKLKVKKDGGDVDAISGSTISSRAYCDALEQAVRIYGEVKQ